MPRQYKQRTKKSAKPPKSLTRKPSMPHVISLRVNDQEKLLLDQISRKKYKNVSAVVREALEHWLAR